MNGWNFNSAGFWGLLGIALLILIYIIKPNFQQKMISSTFVWKLSLKYRKRRIPTSKLRDLLIIICQVLILTSCALILINPAPPVHALSDNEEAIIIIDSSASMYTKDDLDVTRFERAVARAKELAAETFENDGEVSVVIADSAPYFLVSNVKSDMQDLVFDKLDSLVANGELQCYYGSSDMDAAIRRADEIIAGSQDAAGNQSEANLTAKIYIYTDRTYDYVHEDITLVNVSMEGEYNVAVLDATAELIDNYYTISIQVASYGSNEDVNVNLYLSGVNVSNVSDGDEVILSETVSCHDDMPHNIIFRLGPQEEKMESDDAFTYYYETDDTGYVYSYKSIRILLTDPDTGDMEFEDSYALDNDFQIFDGERQVVRIQYCSENSNIFVNSMLSILQGHFKKKWDIRFTNVKNGDEPALEGFDFYIFEDSPFTDRTSTVMPESLPTDGVVWLINPKQAPNGSDITISEIADYNGERISLDADPENTQHPIIGKINVSSIDVSRISVISNYDGSDYGYDVLAWRDRFPVLLAKNDRDSQVMVMSFSVHFSNITQGIIWPLFWINMFNYYYPTTVEKNSYEIGETVEINARGEEILLISPALSGLPNETLTEFPYKKAPFSVPGVYGLEQTTPYGKELRENIYVRCPVVESNIWASGGSLIDPYQVEDETQYWKDLLLYIAIALVSLLFIEWWLQARGNM